jgi:uncharacterized membrane protein
MDEKAQCGREGSRMTDRPENGPTESPEESMPFVAPCREVGPGAPFQWIAAGMRDMRAAPKQSLTWGLVVLGLSWMVSMPPLLIGNKFALLGLLSGFVFLGPLLAIALYAISWRLDHGREPTFRRSLAETRRQISNCMVFALVLMVIFLVWARAASMVHVFFPVEADPEIGQIVRFLAIGSAVGSIFAAITFAASAFSLPMIMDRQVDTITAVITSINAVLRNKPAMAVWLGIIIVSVAIGFATAFIGLVVLFPLLGHATWRSYQAVIDASAWPKQEPMGLP